MTNSLLNNRISRTTLCAGFIISMLAADVCLAGHTKNIMLTGYWPPTNEMLRKFSTDPVQNPGGWQGQNWEGRGYDIYAYFPEFPGGTGSNPKGNGDFEIDYQDVASWQPPSASTGDFWRITGLIHPVAIMSFGQGSGPWEIECNARNLPSSTWSNDYLSPYKPTPAPPDTTQSSGYVRHSSLPVEAIADAVNSSGLGINAWVDWDVDPGHFLCEYMAYHDSWYQSLHSDPCAPYYCVAAGFTHLASSVTAGSGTAGVEAALRALISHLDSQLIQYTISGTVTAGGSPLAGVTMCGLPGNPVTNSSGVYTAQVGAGWSGAVTPLKSGYALIQKTYTNVNANQSAQDYTASVATADTIQFDAASSAGSGTSGAALSWSHTVGSGSNRVLVVGVVTEDSTAADQIITGVKFNSIDMIPTPGSTKSRVVYSGTSYSRTLRTDLYYMLDPPVGTYTVLITYNGSVSYRVGGAISLNNVKQQVPEVIVTNSATSTSISTNINIPNIGAWVVDVVGHSNSGSFTSSTSTERWDRNSGYHTGGGSTKAVTTPGSNTITWNYSGSSGAILHSLAAFAPSETISTPITRTLTVSSSAGGTVTTPGVGDFNYPDGNVISLVASADLNHHFVNWTGTAVDAGKVTDPNAASTTVTMDADYTVQANFAIDTHTVTFVEGANGGITGSLVQVVAHGSDCTAVTAVADPSYHFDGWTGDYVGMDNPLTITNVTADMTITANFAIDTHTVTFVGNIDGNSVQVVEHGGDCTPVTALADPGYHFDGWTGDYVGIDNPLTIQNVTADMTITANFAIDTHTVTFIEGANGSITGTLVQIVNHGSDCTLVMAVPDTNYHFDGWAGDYVGMDNPLTVTNVTADMTITADFAIDTHTVTIVAGPHGSIIGDPWQVVDHGDDCTPIFLEPDPNYHFCGWTGDYEGIDDPLIVTNVTSDMTIVANFCIDTHTVTFVEGANGSITGTLVQVIDHGSDCTAVTAVADPNYHFDGWTGDYVGMDNPLTITNVTADMNITATFAIDQYAITASADANGSISPSGTIYKDYGSSQLFTASADAGYQVNEWKVDDISVQTGGTTYTLENITATHTVSVTFSRIILSISGCVVELDGNTPVEGVLISASDANTFTDANGYYEMSVEYGWSGLITPQKEGHIFEPSSNIYTNVTQDHTDQNYIATLMTFEIAGNVFEGDYVTPINDVDVSAENGGGPWTSRYDGSTCLTDVNGYYEVWVDYNWSGNVVPVKYAHAFEPTSRYYEDVNEDYIVDQDFNGILLTFRISGYIKNDCNVPIEGVLVNANNGGSMDTTDVNGFYEVWVDYNWSGAVTATKKYYAFDPNHTGYVDLLADHYDQNYVADNIYDLDCDGLIGLGDVYVIADNWLLAGSEIPFNVDGNVNFFDFAEFGIVWKEEKSKD